MPNDVNQTPERLGKLRQRFLDLINGREQGWPAREEFFRWMRQEMNAHGRLEPYWASLRAGHPVPWRLIEWLAVYAASNWQWEESATAMGIEVQPDAAQARELDADNVWKKSAGWRALFGVLTKTFRACDEMFCRSQEDIRYAAETVTRWAGRKMGAPEREIGDEEAQRLGERFMQITTDQYAAWLQMLYEQDSHTVMFPVLPRRQKGGYERVGVWVNVPLTDTAAERFLKGEINDFEVGRTDVRCPSGHVLMSVLAEPIDLQRYGQHRLSVAQAHCMAYQLAWLTRRKRRNQWPPRVLCFGTNEDYIGRLTRFGFEETGPLMHGTPFKVMLLAPPKDRSRPAYLDAWLAYKTFLMVIRLFQVANHEEWREPPTKA